MPTDDELRIEDMNWKFRRNNLSWKWVTLAYTSKTQLLPFFPGHVHNFPYSPTGWQTRLVQYPELRCIHAISIYGATIQISSRGYTPGYLNQTLVLEILNLCVLGNSCSNSSFHHLSWSPRNSPQTQAGGYTRPPEVVRARQTPKELHL